MDFIAGVISAPFICMGWIIVGALAGSLARSIMKSDNKPFINDVLLGIVGAFIGGLIAGFVGLGPGEDAAGLQLVIINLILATIGAIVIIGVQRAVTR
jgi:uncharacterized membrane protein YeaQ/YmgE (transglycosylase-associated protein family)